MLCSNDGRRLGHAPYPQVSTAIHRKEKVAKKKRGPAYDGILFTSQQPNGNDQQHDTLTWLNYMTFLNGLDR
jgi:hypothetical protein